MQNQNTNKNIYIIQNERPDKKLLFMYKPFVNTIYKLFENSQFLYNKWNIKKFKEHDTVICIGCFFCNNFLKELKLEKKVYVIFYWTEPFVVNENISKYCDEIYLYSKYIFQLQEKSFVEQKISFIPILQEKTTSYMNYMNKNKNMKLCFLGDLKFKGANLRKMFLNQNWFISKYNLFDDEQYNMYMINNTNIFLNLNSQNVLPFARICKLLSHKCLVISQHCNKEDEEILKDVVYFCNVEDIKKTFDNLLSKSPIELQNYANEKYIKFCAKFDVKNHNLFLTK